MNLNQRQLLKHALTFLVLFSGIELSAQVGLRVNLGADTILPLKQSSATSIHLAPKVQGGPVSFAWTQSSGSSVTIQSPSSQNTTITGFEVGYYTFKCSVSDGINTSEDVINIRVVNYQKKNRIPCRTGAPVVWTLSATNTTDLIKPYLRRDGMDIRGGDTIKINRNPNNGGVYSRFYLGDFGGDEGCPVIVVPNGQVVEIGGPSHRWHIGKNNNLPTDSNFVNHAVIDGTYLRNKGIAYGFQSTGSSWGISTSMVTDLEIKGCLFKNNSLGIQMKIYSDSAYRWTVYDNFIMKNIKINDNYFQNVTNTEGMYLGHTSPSGESQAGNNGPTIRMDSVFIYNNFIDSTGWDPIQISSARYAEMHDNIIMHSAVQNASSQNWGMLMGGNCTGKMYNNIIYRGTSGTMGSMGYGNTEIFYNFIDSTSGNAVYVNGVTNGILEASISGMLPPVKINVHDNIISRATERAVFHGNNDRRAVPGIIRNNYVVDPVKSISQAFATNARDVISGNSMIRNFPVTIKSLGNARTGVKIQVIQGPAVDTFTNSKDAIDWLYSRVSGTPPPNMLPSAYAGTDRTILLPVNSVSLVGQGTDTDGIISGYAWTKIAGPTQYNIVNAASQTTAVNDLVQGVYKFRLQVMDNVGASAFDTVTITVNAPPPPNRAPTADAGNNGAITLPVNSATLSGSGTDTDGTVTIYSWTKITGPTQFNILNPANATATATNLVQGVYSFRLQVTDNSGATGADTVIVTVNAPLPPGNVAPTADAGDDETIVLPLNSITLNGSGIDTDGSITAYSWTKVAGPAESDILNAFTATTAVNNLVQGIYKFRLQVTDNSGATDADTVTIAVSAPLPPGNVAPTANAGNDEIIVLPLNSITLNGSGIDTDGSITAYSWTKVAGPTESDILNEFAATTVVNNLVQGIYKFRLQVTDNSGAIDVDTVTITVNAPLPPVNILPVANAGSSYTITLPDNNVVLNGSGSDADGTIVEYSWTKVSGPTQFAFASATAAQATVTNLVKGTYKFQLQVTDNSSGTHVDTAVVVVLPANDPPANNAPQANAGTDITIVSPASSVTLKGNGIDADGYISTYKWTKISGPAQHSILTSESAQTLVNNLVQGVYEFRLQVTDNLAGTDADTVKVTINAAPPAPANTAPVANAGTNATITLPVSSITLRGSGVDADGVIAAYLWKKISGPASFTISNSAAAQPTVTNLIAGTYQFELTVTDNRGASGKAVVTVIVKPRINIKPKASAGEDQRITLPANKITLTGEANDTDGSITEQKWKEISGAATYTIVDPSSLQTEVTGLDAGHYIFELAATDNNGAITRDTVKVEVQMVLVSSASIYPNPASDRVNLQIVANTHANVTSVVIYDVTGKPVSQTKFMRTRASMTHELNISNLPAGIYFVEVAVDINNKKTCKLIKN
jgi:hypothetical protein